MNLREFDGNQVLIDLDPFDCAMLAQICQVAASVDLEAVDLAEAARIYSANFKALTVGAVGSFFTAERR